MISSASNPNENIIAELFRYHLSETHLPSGVEVLKRECLLFLLGLGGLNYVPVAYQNGSTDEIKIINAVTTGVFGWMVLYVSGMIYYHIKIQPQYVDKSLAHIIQAPLSPAAFASEVSTQLLWAAASAVPLATTLFSANVSLFETYPEIFWATFIYILIVNTVMHLIPVELTMNDPMYGFFPQLFSRAVRSVFGYQLSPEEQGKVALLAERNKAVSDIKSRFLGGKDSFLNELRSLSKDELRQKIDTYREDPKLLFPTIQLYSSSIPPLGVYEEKVVRLMGAVNMFIACLGYAASPYLVFRQDFGLAKSYAITAVSLPVYFFMLLMVYFGDNIGVRCWRDVLASFRILSGESAWNHKSPLIVKLYPKSFFLLEGIMLFSMVFSGAAAREMIDLAFGKIFPMTLMMVVKGIADIVLALLARYVFLDVTKIILTYYAQYMDQDPLILFKTQFEALMRDLDRIQPTHVAALQAYVDQSSLEEVRFSGSSASSSCCFHWFNKADGANTYEDPLLIRPSAL